MESQSCLSVFTFQESWIWLEKPLTAWCSGFLKLWWHNQPPTVEVEDLSTIPGSPAPRGPRAGAKINLSGSAHLSPSFLALCQESNQRLYKEHLSVSGCWLGADSPFISTSCSLAFLFPGSKKEGTFEFYLSELMDIRFQWLQNLFPFGSFPQLVYKYLTVGCFRRAT